MSNTDLPDTINECFAAWCSLRQADDDTDKAANAKAEARSRIELHAVTLPAVSACDVWRLVAMTTDLPAEGFEDERTDLSHNMMIARAYRETRAGESEPPRRARDAEILRQSTEAVRRLNESHQRNMGITA